MEVAYLGVHNKSTRLPQSLRVSSHQYTFIPNHSRIAGPSGFQLVLFYAIVEILDTFELEKLPFEWGIRYADSI